MDRALGRWTCGAPEDRARQKSVQRLEADHATKGVDSTFFTSTAFHARNTDTEWESLLSFAADEKSAPKSNTIFLIRGSLNLQASHLAVRHQNNAKQSQAPWNNSNQL